MQARKVPTNLRSFRKSVVTTVDRDDHGRVLALAHQLRDYLTAHAADIDEAHVFAAQSARIQELVGRLLTRVGFVEELVLKPDEGFVTRARPDFFFELGEGRGVIAEVERGGTVDNNHDLKDLWKAHVAVNVQHLFLVVPNCNFKADGSPREKPYLRVSGRMSSFFGDPRREIDLVSLHVFGYGRL